MERLTYPGVSAEQPFIRIVIGPAMHEKVATAWR